MLQNEFTEIQPSTSEYTVFIDMFNRISASDSITASLLKTCLYCN